MLTPPAGLAVYVATKPFDFRKGAESLALLARGTLGHDPLKGVAVGVAATPSGARPSAVPGCRRSDSPVLRRNPGFARSSPKTAAFIEANGQLAEHLWTVADGSLADGVRFELTVRVNARRFSRPLP